MIYIASPYTALNADGTQDEQLKHKRFIEAGIACGFLMLKGEFAYSPISHWHIIDELFKGAIQYEDYLANDCHMIDLCSELHVLMLDGWDVSKGVLIEIEYAKMKNIPVKYFTIHSQGVEYAETH